MVDVRRYERSNSRVVLTRFNILAESLLPKNFVQRLPVTGLQTPFRFDPLLPSSSIKYLLFYISKC